MRVRVSGIGTFTLIFLLLAVASSQAQVAPASAPMPPPAPGFVPPYEIIHTLHSAGFDPLGPPFREGATYVVRANDYRGILMRVVVDARTGAIRDANRILPARAPTRGSVCCRPMRDRPLSCRRRILRQCHRRQ